MANSLNTNPIILDTFSADVTVTTSHSRIVAVYLYGVAEDHLVLEDASGNHIVDLVVVATDATDQAGSDKIVFGYPGFPVAGLVCDVSDGSYAAGAKALIYLA